MKKDNTLVHVRVVKHLPQGLSVELDTGERGIIRAREISWDKNDAVNWRENYPIGWEGEAFPFPARKDEAAEFSLRLVSSDPWDDFSKNFGKSEIFDGVVTGVHEYGVFIEIKPGIAGLLRKQQIPTYLQSSILDLFWHGDQVFVAIREIDYTEKLIELKLAPAGAAPVDNDATVRLSRSSMRNTIRTKQVEISRRRVLVVEDEPVQAQTVSGWLRDLNQSVDAVATAADALAFFEKTQPDIVFVNIDLQKTTGVELAHRILRDYPHTQVVSVADWARANEVKIALDELQALGGKLLYKPILPEDLEAYLLTGLDQSAAPPQEETLPLPNLSILDAKMPIHTLLAECRKNLSIEQIFLFSLDPAHRLIHVVEHVGDGIINKDAISQLIHSPVRDVAEDRDIVMANEIGEHDRKRFRYLLEFTPAIGSCVGVPVPAQTPFKYALFALDRHSKQFSGERHLYLQGVALAVGAALDQKDLRERSALIQRSALAGNLAGGMMHEIGNLVGPLLLGTNTLGKKLAQFEKDASSASYLAFSEDVVRIQQDVRRIVNATRAFGRITAKGRSEILKIDEIIEETIMLLHDISEGSNVSIGFNGSSELHLVLNQAAILGQILLNVMLNAIQQIVEFRPGIRGWVKVSMQIFDDAARKTRCRVFIEDNGPGIHFRLWEKVFDIGHTTRREGSGIGLYVSRNLMRDIGGEIYISKSHILSGTTFVLEFPVNM